MKATLVIPSPTSFARKYQLAPRTGTKRGFRVARSNFGSTLNGLLFQDLRDVLGATIETDNAEKTAKLLGLPLREPGLIAIK